MVSPQNPNWENVPWGGTKSHTARVVTLTLAASQETMTIPCEVTTKVIEVKWGLCQRLGIETNRLQFILKQASSYRIMKDEDEMPTWVTVRGIKQWSREKARYPHPHCIIGAGHSGLRAALSFMKEGIADYVGYERLSQVGGNAWVCNANPTSKLQTELGVYHLQYDPLWECPRATMKTWPTRDDLLAHFEEVSKEFGTFAHFQLSTEVTEVKVVTNDKEAPFHDPYKQHYEVVSTRLDSKTGEEVEMTFSTISDYPGALTNPNRMEFKGEDVFEGQIGYGMFDEFDYPRVDKEITGVIGFGAFAVENIRTCVEHGAKLVYLVCRRKNISMPRVISWFINQSLYPPPGAMCLDAMKPMYDLIPDDVWDFYGVMANKDRTTATIRQKSRFGIGDFYFLCHYYKKVEVVVDAIKRLKPHQIVFESGQKVECDHIIKVLGFKPDMSVDKMMGIKEMVGFFANGDWRRWVCTEFPGVDAGKFGGTSFSPGAIANVDAMSWFINFPKDLGPVFDSQMLPRHKADKEKMLPAYVWDPRQGSSVGMLIGGGIIPGLAELGAAYGPLNRQRQLEAHPLEQFIDECAEEWYGYCQMFKDRGDDRPFPPYPYTYEYVRELCQRNDDEGEADARRQAERMGG